MILAMTSLGAMAAAITAISPVSGSTAGGTVVTITTSGYAALTVAGTGVTFGGTAGTVTAISGAGSNIITVTTPARAVGTVPVVVTFAAVTATRNNGFTYSNTTLRIIVTVNIPRIVSIQWGMTSAATGTDDGGVDHSLALQKVTDYGWYVNYDGRSTSFTQLNTLYNSSTLEGRTITIESLSTNNRTKIAARATDPINAGNIWSLGAAAAPSQIRLNAQLTGAGTNAALNLTNTDQDLTPTTQIAVAPVGVNNPLTLVLLYTTPTSAILATLGVDMVSTITLTGSAF